MNKQRKSLSVKLRLTAWIAAISVSVVLLTAAGNKNFEITKQLDIFSTMFKEVVVNYVDEVNVSDMMKSGIDGMLSTLDPYTTFIPESQIEDVRFMTTGQYGGIGAVIRSRNDHMMIVEPYQGFPAHQAGLIPGVTIKSQLHSDFIISASRAEATTPSSPASTAKFDHLTTVFSGSSSRPISFLRTSAVTLVSTVTPIIFGGSTPSFAASSFELSTALAIISFPPKV